MGTGQLEVWLWKRDWYGSVIESMGFKLVRLGFQTPVYYCMAPFFV